jgi:1-deoxy-D-xylulose-5-phosphate reductoisomerase
MSRATQHRRLILLGSTGSIGTNVLEVVDHLRREGLCEFEVVGLATGGNARGALEQARRLGVKHVAIADAQAASGLAGVPHVYRGPDAAQCLVEAVAQAGDLLVGAMVGSAGLPATLAAIERGCDIALANKETLVAAGALVMQAVRARGVALLPVDSEHSAVFQCLQAGRTPQELKRIVLTASGGPFRTWPTEDLYNATVEQTLSHPTWSMGPKITVDSASLMNKALEVIEAHWLFGLEPARIDVVVHPQSIVHSLVEFVDGSVVAQLSPPDMRSPIQYALTWPQRAAGCARLMDFSQALSLDFEPLDAERFPAVTMAYEVVAAGGTAGAVLNAANEAAVSAFLAGRIPFGVLPELVRGALERVPARELCSLEDVRRADRSAREEVAAMLESRASRHSRGGEPAVPARPAS